jgi:hypothetical protein
MDERDDEFEKKTGKHPAPFSVRLSEEEREELAKLAEGQPWGQYIKDVIFREKRKTRRRTARLIKDHKLLAKLLGLLGRSRIANNINQLAKAANSGSLPVTPDVHKALIEATRSVQQMRHMLIEAMGLRAEKEDDPDGEER